MNPDCEKYTNLAGVEHRKKFGQFFTPPDVARFMVQWVLERDGQELYDPAFGLGAFFDASVDYPKLSFWGSDIDATIVEHWKKETGRELRVRVEDYLQTWGNQWANIVCNPPYMRFQKFSGRKEVISKFQDKLNIRLSGYTNIASAFLIKSISELSDGGKLAYIMPLEFLNTGYGKTVKELLLRDKHLASIIQLRCENEIFPDTTTSVGIILYDKKREYHHVNFYSLTSAQELTQNIDSFLINRMSVNSLSINSKWLALFQRNTVKTKRDFFSPLKSYGNFKRGVATGANEYFVLKPSVTRKLGLTDRSYIPCISKSAQISKGIFDESDYVELFDADSAVLLFNGNGSNDRQTDEYIRYGISKNFHKRYLTEKRNPWYKIEHRQPAPIMFNVFSRGGYKVILNNSNAIHLTCYHGFHPDLFGLDYVKRLFLYFFSETGKTILSLSKRQYGNDLDKFEPNDLNDALVPSPSFLDNLSTDLVESALLSIKENGALPHYAEDCFSSLLVNSRLQNDSIICER